MAELVVVATGVRHALVGRTVVGRDADVTLGVGDPLVSGRHAELLLDATGTWRVVDLGATHGTYVNSTRVKTRKLAHGDEITVGATQLRFEDHDFRAVPAGDISVTTQKHVVQHRLAMVSQPFPRASELALPPEASRDYERLRIAFEIGQAFAAATDLDSLLREILERVFELVPAERASIMLVDPATKQLVPRVALQRGSVRTVGPLPLPRSILEEVAAQRVGLVAMDAMADERFGGRASVMSGGVRGVLSAPMQRGGDLVGVLYLDARVAGVFGERDLEVINVIANQAALAVRTAQQRSTQETQERLALVSQVASGLSHDFANVLTMVLAAAEEIYSDDSVPEEHRRNARDIETAAVHAARLTRRMGKLARGSTSELKRVDLGHFLAEAAEIVQQTLGAHTKLVVTAPAAPLVVVADPLELEQIVLNLAFNARDAMPGGGQLAIELGRVHDGGRDLATIAVSDTGTGMAPDVIARAFEPFFTTKAAGRGTGMGLAVVHRLVTEAKGAIAIESTLGRGTTFRIRWPLTGVTEPVVERGPDPADLAAQAILVVDGDQTVGSAMVKSLEVAGYTVLRAANGEDALAIAKRTKVRALIAEVVLAGMSGRQLAERLRAMQPAMRVLYVSGHLDPQEANELTALDARVLAKPFTQQQLVAKLGETLTATPRSATRLAVTLRTDQGLHIASHTQDVRTNGFVVATDHHLDIGTKCHVLVSFPGRSTPLALRGHVLSSTPSGPRRGVGVQLAFSSPQQEADVATELMRLAALRARQPTSSPGFMTP